MNLSVNFHLVANCSRSFLIVKVYHVKELDYKAKQSMRYYYLKLATDI